MRYAAARRARARLGPAGSGSRGGRPSRSDRNRGRARRVEQVARQQLRIEQRAMRLHDFWRMRARAGMKSLSPERAPAMSYAPGTDA